MRFGVGTGRRRKSSFQKHGGEVPFATLEASVWPPKDKEGKPFAPSDAGLLNVLGSASGATPGAIHTVSRFRVDNIKF